MWAVTLSRESMAGFVILADKEWKNVYEMHGCGKEQ
jgi:hypothetical protein